MSDNTSTRHSLDLRHFHATHTRGDITIVLTWLLTTGEPCMVLIPTFARIEDVRPYVIPMSRAWIWNESLGDWMQAWEGVGEAAALMNLSCDTATLHRVYTMIFNHIEDLVKMPPLPTDAMTPVAEAEITDLTTGKVIEKEVEGHV